MFNYLSTGIFFLICVTVCPAVAASQAGDSSMSSTVAFVKSFDKPTYNKVISVAQAYLAPSSTSFSGHSFPSYLANNWLLLNKENKQSYKIVIAVGTAACSVLLQQYVVYTKSKILCSFLPKQAFHALFRKYHISVDQTKNILAIYLDQPFIRQVQFIRQLIPSVKRIGILVSEQDVRSNIYLKKLTEKFGLSFNVLQYRKNGTTEKELRLMIANSDVFLAIPDPKVHSPRLAKWLLYNTYREKKPIVAFSTSYLRAGALAAIYSTPEQIGRHTGEFSLSWLEDKTEKPVPTSDPLYFSIAVNRTVTTSLGLKIMDNTELLKNIANDYDL